MLVEAETEAAEGTEAGRETARWEGRPGPELGTEERAGAGWEAGSG